MLAKWLLSQGLADPAATPLGSPSPALMAAQTSRFNGQPRTSMPVQRLFRRAAEPWKISTHVLFGPGYRRTVQTLLLVQRSLATRNILGVTLPLEMWLKIASMMCRSDHDTIAPLCRVSFGVDVNADDLQVLVANIGDVLVA